MQKNEGLIFSFSDKIVSDFHREMEIVPDNTPLFVCDNHGKILYRYRFEMPQNAVDDISALADEEELAFYLAERTRHDCIVVEMTRDKSDQFIVLSKTESTLTRGVVCSCSESTSQRLCDYFEKLCSYKDYLSSFSTIAFSDLHEFSPVKRLMTRINGTSSLMELCDFDFLANEEKYYFPLVAAVQKIAAFVEANCEGLKVDVTDRLDGFEAIVKIPLRFLKLLVSCISLAARYSKNGRVSAEICSVCGCKANINISTPSYVDTNSDILAKTITHSLNGMGIVVNIHSHRGMYTIEMELSTEEKKAVSLAEEDELMYIVSELLSQTYLSDMVYTIAN